MQEGWARLACLHAVQWGKALGMNMFGREDGPTASFVAAAMPSSAAHRRPGTVASADTVHKWEQLLRDHPNDPMVSAFSLARLLFVRCAFLCVRREGVSALVYLPCKVTM